MLELMGVAAIILFALGFFIGRESSQQERSQEKLEELEQLSQFYRPIIKDCNDQISRINAARIIQ